MNRYKIIGIYSLVFLFVLMSFVPFASATTEAVYGRTYWRVGSESANEINLTWEPPTGENLTEYTSNYLYLNFSANGTILTCNFDQNTTGIFSNQSGNILGETCNYNFTALVNGTYCAYGYGESNSSIWSRTSYRCWNISYSPPPPEATKPISLIEFFDVIKGETVIGYLISFVSNNLILIPQDIAPSNPGEGTMFYNSSDHTMYYWNSTAWRAI